MKQFLLFFTLLPAVVLANENSCPEMKVFPNVDLRKDYGPIRDQGNAGWCYAYATSDVLNYVLKKKYGIDTSKKDNQVSAAAMALDNFKSKGIQLTNLLAEVNTDPYKNKFSRLKKKKEEELLKAAANADRNNPEYKKSLDEKFAMLRKYVDGQGDKYPQAKKHALDMIKDRDYAKALATFQTLNFTEDADIEKADFEYLIAKQLAADTSPESQLKTLTLDKAWGGLPEKNLNRILKDGYCTEDEVPTLETDKSYQAVLKIMELDANTPRSTVCEAESAAKSLFPKESLTSIKITLDNASRSESNSLSRLVQKSCKRKKLPLPTPSIKDSGWDSKAIKNQLSKDNPIILSLDAKIFYRDQASILDPETRLWPNHVVTIVGQRYNCETKQTEYIVRNSWGSGACNNSKASIHPTNKTRQDSTKCDNGDFVIPEPVLRKSTLSMTYLDSDNQ